MDTTPGRDIKEEGGDNFTEYFENDVKSENRIQESEQQDGVKYNSCDEIQKKTESNKIHKCEFCRYQSKRKDSVTIHENSVHRKHKFPCDLCGYKATTQSSLTTHKQSKHEGIKYACSKCDKQFTFKVALTRHIQSVHDGKKYQCKGCNQASHRGDLNTHVLSLIHI